MLQLRPNATKWNWNTFGLLMVMLLFAFISLIFYFYFASLVVFFYEFSFWSVSHSFSFWCCFFFAFILRRLVSFLCMCFFVRSCLKQRFFFEQCNFAPICSCFHLLFFGSSTVIHPSLTHPSLSHSLSFPSKDDVQCLRSHFLSFASSPFLSLCIVCVCFFFVRILLYRLIRLANSSY